MAKHQRKGSRFIFAVSIGFGLACIWLIFGIISLIMESGTLIETLTTVGIFLLLWLLLHIVFSGKPKS